MGRERTDIIIRVRRKTHAGILHPELKAALARGDAFSVFEFDDPGGTTYRYAGGWIDSKSLGSFKGFIPENGFGRSKRAIPIRGDRLQSAAMSVTVADMDGAINDLVSGQYSRRVRGLDSRIRIVAPDIDPDAYYLRFKGQILRYGKNGDGEYKFELGSKAPELKTFLRLPIITKAIWPNADASALEKRTPLVYGIHSSASLGSRGMLPTLYVDTTNFRYLVSHQYLKEITNVYVDDAVQASGWTEINRVVEGHRYTLVEFDSDQGSATITVDAKGAVYKGDPNSYEVLTNPAAQFKAILANYVFHEWNGEPGVWHDESDSAIHKESFHISEQFYNSRGIKGSLGITEPMTGLALINMFSSQYYPTFWTSDAKLAILPDDWYRTEAQWSAGITTRRADRIWLRESEHFVGKMAYDYSTEMLIDEWSVGFLFSHADSIALERISVKDTLRGWNVSEKLELTWAESTI